MSDKITVVVADDSPVVRKTLERIFSSAPGIEVIGLACNGEEALKLVKQKNPSVLCTDLHMPVMDGLELTRRVMAEHPLPIIVVSVSVMDSDESNIFALLEAGAIDVFAKPRAGFTPDSQEARALIERIRLIAGVRVLRKRNGLQAAEPIPVQPSATQGIVAIGASTGGPQALREIFSKLPADFPLPILCVQHVSEGFLDSLITWLDESTPLHVAIAVQGEHPKPGHIYFPRERQHLIVNGQGRLENLDREVEGEHKPAVNILFRSLPEYYGQNVLAVLLTGMGQDGAEGMAEVINSGGASVVQDEASSVVFGMPKAAMEMCRVDHVLPLGEIARVLLDYAERYRGRAIR